MMAAEYQAQLAALLPPGPALSRDPDSVVMRLLAAPAAELARVEARAAALLDEADPQDTQELFGEWEALVGLPDDCQPIERFSRASQAWWFDAEGRLRRALPHELRRPPLGRPSDPALVEPARVNLVRNPRAEGAAVGSPGTSPTFWATGGAGGISASIREIGVALDVPYVDVRFAGTVASTGSGFVWFETANHITALTGEALAHSYFFQLREAAAGLIATHQAWIAEINSSVGVVRQEAAAQPLPTGSTLAGQRAIQLMTTSGGPATAFVRPFVAFNFNAGTHDVTVRLALPQMERGGSATSPILPEPGVPLASSRAADELSVAGLAERRARIVSRLTQRPGQSRAFFISLAASLGVAATITEFQETNCEAGCEEPVCGPDWRHAWRMNLPSPGARTLATCQDTVETPLAQWAASPIECLIRRLAPAHTIPLFAYA